MIKSDTKDKCRILDKRTEALAARGRIVAAVYCAVLCDICAKALLIAARAEDIELARVVLLYSTPEQLRHFAPEVESFVELIRPHSLPLAFLAMLFHDSRMCLPRCKMDPVQLTWLLDGFPSDPADTQPPLPLLRLLLWSLAVETCAKLFDKANSDMPAQYSILEALQRRIPSDLFAPFIFFLVCTVHRYIGLSQKGAPLWHAEAVTRIPADARFVLAAGSVTKHAITAQLNQAASAGLADPMSRLYCHALFRRLKSGLPRGIGYACRQGCALALSIAEKVVPELLSEKRDGQTLRESLLKGFVRAKLKGVLPVSCVRVIERLAQVRSALYLPLSPRWSSLGNPICIHVCPLPLRPASWL